MRGQFAIVFMKILGGNIFVLLYRNGCSMKHFLYVIGLLGLVHQLNSIDKHTALGLVSKKEAYTLYEYSSYENSSEANWIKSLEKRRMQDDDYVKEEDLQEMLKQKMSQIQKEVEEVSDGIHESTSEERVPLDVQKSEFDAPSQIQRFFMRIIASIWGSK